jgi:hypothetical protein
MKILITERQLNLFNDVVVEPFHIPEEPVQYSDSEVVEKVIRGFKLTSSPKGFGNPFTTVNEKPTINLIHKMNDWIKEKFPYSSVRVNFELRNRTIHFYKKS